MAPALRTGRRLAATARAAGIVVVTGLLTGAAGFPQGYRPSPAGPAQAAAAHAPAPGRNERLGLAHIDNMDLHLQRRSDGPPAAVEQLPAADLAERFAVAAATGAAWHRWSMYWDLIDRGGGYEWSASDQIVARDVAAGFRTLAVVQGVPPGVAHLAGAPPGIDQPVFRRADGTLTDDPDRAAGVNEANPWARFVAALCERYRPGGALAAERGWPATVGVRTWEIGNEPNLPFFWPGTPAEFARYLAVAYLVLKRHDPAAMVVHGGIANDANAEAWFGAFLDALATAAGPGTPAARHGGYFDRTAWHWYTVPSNLTVGTPARVAAMLAERGLPAKGLWVTEFGAPLWSEYPGPCWDPASPFRLSLAEQSGFVWQAVAEGLAAGAETMIFFQLYDDCGNGHDSYDAFGLVRNHSANQCWLPPGQGCWQYDPALAGQARPAYAAYRSLAGALAGAWVVENAVGRGWRRVVFSRAPAGRVTIAWNATRAGLSVALPAATARATLYELDPAGNVRSRPVEAIGGGYPVSLPAATNRNGLGGAPLADGRPVMVVEDAVPPAAAIAPGPAGLDRAVVAADGEPPYLALARALPARSPPLFEVTVVAGDAASGLGAYQLFHTVGAPPRQPADWLPVGVPLPWPGTPTAGLARVPFVGAPGVTYYFAAAAADRAGNWTPLPPYPQTSTRVQAESRSVTPMPARPRAGSRAADGRP